MFYLAVRISPTFNPEKKVWGTFDLEYAINFALKYTAGIDESHAGVQSGVGRLGALTWMLERFSQGRKNVVFGRGNEYITYASKDDYFNATYYGGIQGRGNITGIVSTFFTLGVVGIAFYLLFFVCAFLSNKSKSNHVLLGVMLVDYIFYNAHGLNATYDACIVPFVFFYEITRRILAKNKNIQFGNITNRFHLCKKKTQFHKNEFEYIRKHCLHNRIDNFFIIILL